MTTDGEYLVFELADPMSVNPLKYGSSEIDPDPVVTVLKLRNEILAVNRYTIEIFNQRGRRLVPVPAYRGRPDPEGAVGTFAACIFADTVAFLGSGRNETPGVYLGVNGATTKISTLGIDGILEGYTEAELAVVTLETHVHQSHPQLWIRLPDRTLVYDLDASQATSVPVWFQLTSAAVGFEQYRIVDPVWCYDAWHVCDVLTGDFGIMTPDSARHFGEVVRWGSPRRLSITNRAEPSGISSSSSACPAALMRRTIPLFPPRIPSTASPGALRAQSMSECAATG